MSDRPQHQLEKCSFRFKREYCSVDRTFNLPTLIIQAGHGYDLRTYMCVSCGTIVVIDHELLSWEKTDINGVVNDLSCKACGRPLSNSLVEYPEHVFHNGAARKIENTVDRLQFGDVELIDVWTVV